MRTSWRRQPPKGNTLTSWQAAYQIRKSPALEPEFYVECLYEDVSPGIGATESAAKADFLENIRLKITELTEMLEFCAKSDPRNVK
jgi:hypothetical protein